MKTKFFLIGILFALATGLFAQESTLSLEFLERIHDFGQIQETDGKVLTTFEFTNVGQAPITLTNVQASCGCTTPEWSKEPIAPGKKGFINVTYNPKGRPGNFSKTITVRYTELGNETAQAITLNIKGEVIPKPQVTEN